MKQKYLLLGVTQIIAALVAVPAQAEEVQPKFSVDFSLDAGTDYMYLGLTKSDNKPSAGFTITPTYGIFYAKIKGFNIDYGSSEPKWEGKYGIGMSPSFGDFSADFYLEREDLASGGTFDRWMPYVTGTYKVDDKLTTSLGVGYFAYDEAPDFWEVYTATTYTPNDKVSFTFETSTDFDFDDQGTDYQELVLSTGVTLTDKIEFGAKLAREMYFGGNYADYNWYELSLKYKFDDHFSASIGYQGNDISSGGCSTVAYTDCDNSLFAKVSYKFSLADIAPRKN